MKLSLVPAIALLAGTVFVAAETQDTEAPTELTTDFQGTGSPSDSEPPTETLDPINDASGTYSPTEELSFYDTHSDEYGWF